MILEEQLSEWSDEKLLGWKARMEWISFHGSDPLKERMLDADAMAFYRAVTKELNHRMFVYFKKCKDGEL